MTAAIGQTLGGDLGRDSGSGLETFPTLGYRFLPV